MIYRLEVKLGVHEFKAQGKERDVSSDYHSWLAAITHVSVAAEGPETKTELATTNDAETERPAAWNGEIK